MIPTPKPHPQLSGENFAFIGISPNTNAYEYLAKDGASFGLSPPAAICSHFTVSKYLFV